MRSIRVAIPALVTTALALAACGERGADHSRSLSEIRTSGTLVVLTRNAPTTWYIGRDDAPHGPEHDMATAFARSLGVEVEFRVKETIADVLAGIESGEGDLAAAGLTVTEGRTERFRFGPAYQRVIQQVVCRRDGVRPKSVADLVGTDLRVVAESSYAQRLAELKADHPGLRWREVEGVGTEALLRGVWEREFDCTVADSTVVNINRRSYPELTTPLDLSRAQDLAWLVARPRRDLVRAIGSWLKRYRADGRLEALRERYYGFFAEFDYVDTRTYIRRIDERLPRYREHFREAAGKYGIPHTLLAAQGYQESHWRPDAVSPTGVRGIMMLTRNTAESVGVSDRIDPRQSIFGGAKYLARLKRRLADEVPEPDLHWLALAAYNIGYGHLRDAQTLAGERGLDPTRWHDLKQVLPLLSEPRHYRRLRYGYARGHDPVRYVRRVREYRHVLEGELNGEG